MLPPGLSSSVHKTHLRIRADDDLSGDVDRNISFLAGILEDDQILRTRLDQDFQDGPPATPPTAAPPAPPQQPGLASTFPQPQLTPPTTPLPFVLTHHGMIVPLLSSLLPSIAEVAAASLPLQLPATA